MAAEMATKYAKAKVNCLRNRADADKIVYVGSTIRTLSERMSEHPAVCEGASDVEDLRTHGPGGSRALSH